MPADPPTRQIVAQLGIDWITAAAGRLPFLVVPYAARAAQDQLLGGIQVFVRFLASERNIERGVFAQLLQQAT